MIKSMPRMKPRPSSLLAGPETSYRSGGHRTDVRTCRLRRGEAAECDRQQHGGAARPGGSDLGLGGCRRAGHAGAPGLRRGRGAGSDQGRPGWELARRTRAPPGRRPLFAGDQRTRVDRRDVRRGVAVLGAVQHGVAGDGGGRGGDGDFRGVLPGHPPVHVPRVAAGSPLPDTAAQWQTSSPQTIATFSAVCYYFGRELHAALEVPVG